jgi:uncharacterized protein YndB with AHSA1/START domain
MGEVKATIDIAAPPEKVWGVVMDPARLGEWVTIHRKLGNVSDRPLEKGSTLEQTLCIRGVNLKVKWKVDCLEDGRSTEWEGKGPARSRARTKYVLTPDGDGGTRFDYENEFNPPFGPLGAAASRALVGGVPERVAHRSLDALKKLVESEA